LPTHFFGFFHFSGFWHFSCNYDQNKKKNFEDKKYDRGPQTPCLAPKSHLKSVFELVEHLKKIFFSEKFFFDPILEIFLHFWAVFGQGGGTEN
jgi:hypothetical protein